MTADRRSTQSTPDTCVVVLELDDVATRIRLDRPNLFVGVSHRESRDLARRFQEGLGRLSWVRDHVVTTRDDMAPEITLTRDEAVELKADVIRRLRTKGYTVNRNTKAYRTYVINFHNPDLDDTGKSYVYVGQTSIQPEERLVQHLTGAISSKGGRLASRVVKRFGRDLNYDLMTSRLYLTERQALKAERRLAERLRQQGYAVEGRASDFDSPELDSIECRYVGRLIGPPLCQSPEKRNNFGGRPRWDTSGRPPGTLSTQSVD